MREHENFNRFYGPLLNDKALSIHQSSFFHTKGTVNLYSSHSLALPIHYRVNSFCQNKSYPYSDGINYESWLSR
jgi:hypothetical protein